MLPFGLKIAWLCFSLTGLLCCWFTLVAFTRAVGVYWPLMYCVGCTLLQVAFSLGMIWKMDPSRMPTGFCMAQSIIIGLGAFIMTGVAAAFSIATNLAVLKPKTWGDGGKSALIWRPLYFVPIAAFPIIASAVQIGLTVRYRTTYHPSDDMHCDYTDPIWIRFLSYAGTPFLLSIPCLYLSIKSIIRVIKTNRHLERSRNPDMDIDHFTAIPRRPNEVHIPRAISTPSPSMNFPPSGSEVTVPALSGALLASRRFHMPFSTSNKIRLKSSISSNPETDEPDSPASSSFPTFVNPSHTGTVSINPDGLSVIEYESRPKEDWRELLGVASWNDDAKSDFQYDNDEIVTEDSATHAHRAMSSIGNFSRRSRRRPPPSLGPAVWRIIVFQLSFTAVQTLASISSLINAIQHRPPSSFGTQHVALLLAAWGPVVIFSRIPTTRNFFGF